MANVINELFRLSREEQEFILENLSHEYNPIEIDDSVYFVEEPVAKLIEELTEENIGFRNRIDELDGIPKN